MSYAEADLLSSTDKAFIRDLFPSGGIYRDPCLSPEAQSVIGKVAHKPRASRKCYAESAFAIRAPSIVRWRPHFVAPADDVTLLRNARVVRIGNRAAEPGPRRALAGERSGPQSPFFRAVPCDVQTLDGDARRGVE